MQKISLRFVIIGLFYYAFVVIEGVLMRRSLYIHGEYRIYIILAGICGGLLLIAFLCFLFNIVMSVGLNGALGIFMPARLKTRELLPPAN